MSCENPASSDNALRQLVGVVIIPALVQSIHIVTASAATCTTSMGDSPAREAA